MSKRLDASVEVIVLGPASLAETCFASVHLDVMMSAWEP